MNGRMMQMIGNIVKTDKTCYTGCSGHGGSLQPGLLGRC